MLAGIESRETGSSGNPVMGCCSYDCTQRGLTDAEER